MAADQLSLVSTTEISKKKKDNDYIYSHKIASSEAKICKTPFYIETRQNGELMIIQEEQDKLYKYVSPISDSKYFVGSYFGDMNSIDNATNSYYDEDPLSGLKAQDMKIVYEEDTYIFTINMYTFLQNYKDSEELKDIISSLGGDTKTYKHFLGNVEYEFF